MFSALIGNMVFKLLILSMFIFVGCNKPKHRGVNAEKYIADADSTKQITNTEDANDYSLDNESLNTNYNFIQKNIGKITLEYIKERSKFDAGKAREALNESYIRLISLGENYNILTLEEQVTFVYEKSGITLQDNCVSSDDLNGNLIGQFRFGISQCITTRSFIKKPAENVESELIGLFLKEFAIILGLSSELAEELRLGFIRNYNLMYPDGLDYLNYTALNSEEFKGYRYLIGPYSRRVHHYFKEVRGLEVGKKYSESEWAMVCNQTGEIISAITVFQNYINNLTSRLKIYFIENKSLTAEEVSEYHERVTGLLLTSTQQSDEYKTKCLINKNRIYSEEMEVLSSRVIWDVDHIIGASRVISSALNKYK